MEHVMTQAAVREVCGKGALTPQDGARLGATIEHAFAVRSERFRSITVVDCRPSPYQSSCGLHEVDVWFADGSMQALIAKAIDWEAMSPEAHRARPQWLSDQQRERAVYESLLSTADVGSASYFGVYVGESGIRYLLLERIDGLPLWQSGNFDTWCEAARWLARMGVRITPDNVARTRAAPHLRRHDRTSYETWMQRASAFHARSNPVVETLSRPYQKVVDWLSCERHGFLHGEFYPSNVMVECRSPLPDVVRPVDWEMAALGPASIDLACLLSGTWTDDERAEIADAYYGELATLGRQVPPRERYLRTLDYALIHLSIRNLGWSADWTPPPDRAHDWLGEALRLCEKWDL
jgi:aminoglycoside phosphotransferase (APT) family kinase protein